MSDRALFAIFRTAKFLFCLFLLTIAFVVLWEVVIGANLYNCTDECGLDYLTPGQWVHGKVAVVPKIGHDQDMSYPDTIKAGWSIGGLWLVWFTCVAFSVAISYLFARTPWVHEINEISERLR